MPEQDANDKARPAGSEDGHRKGGVHVVRVRSLVSVALWAVLIFLAFRFFSATRFLVLGALGASALAAALQPLTRRVPGPCVVKALVTMLLVIVVLGGTLLALGWALYKPVRQSIERLPELYQDMNRGLRSLSQRIGLDSQLDVKELGEIAGSIFLGGSVRETIPSLASGVLTLMLAVLVVVIGAMYLLIHPGGSLVDPAVRLLPPSRQESTRRAVKTLWPELRWWVIGTLFSMLIIGVITGAGYWIIDLKFFLPLALFAGLAQAVPTFGPLVTLAVAVLVAATQGLGEVVGVVTVYLVVQTIESYFLTPMVMKRAVHIPPIVTLFSIILWGNIFGIGGLILAVPLDLTIWAFLREHIADEHDRQAGLPPEADEDT
ncbi:MAG: AI-2E family transporter [Phycisphaerae bacterium]